MEFFSMGIIIAAIATALGIGNVSCEKALEYAHTKIALMEQMNTQKDAQIAELEEKLAASKTRTTELEAKDAQIAGLKASMAGAEKELAAKDAAIYALNQERIARETALQLVRDALEMATQARGATEVEKEDLLAELKKISDQFNELDDFHKKWSRKAQRAIDALELEKQGWAGRVLTLAKEVNALRGWVRADMAERERLGRSRASLAAELDKSEKEQTALRKQLQATHTLLPGLQRNIQRTNAELYEVETRMAGTIAAFALLVLTACAATLFFYIRTRTPQPNAGN